MPSSLTELACTDLETAAPGVLGSEAHRFIRFLVLASNHLGEATLGQIAFSALAITSALQRRIFICHLLQVAGSASGSGSPERLTAADLKAAAPAALGDDAAQFIRFLAVASSHRSDMTLDVIVINSLAIAAAPDRQAFVTNLVRVADVHLAAEPPPHTPLRAS